MKLGKWGAKLGRVDSLEKGKIGKRSLIKLP